METPKIPAAAIPDEDGMLPEYDFTGGVPGKYAGKIKPRIEPVAETGDDTGLVALNSPPTAPQPIEADKNGMLSEYDFDYSQAIRNPFAGKITARSKSVTLTPDVAAVFADSDAVNAALRMLIDIARASAASNPASPSTNAASPESPA